MLNREFHDGGAAMTFEDHVASSCAPELGEVVTTNAPGRVGHNYAHWRVVSCIRDGERYVYRAARCDLDGSILPRPETAEAVPA